ncbi:MULTISPECIES: transposase [unclassified Arthrobacter]|uniref:transposase n=1 Tax=unclassified Arthrobacter TaxID=235627 RepID=UPI00339996F4
MSQFPTAGHLCSWAKFSPGINSSVGKTKGNGSTGHGNRYLARVLGEAAVGAGKTDTFLGERHRRLATRRARNAPSSLSGAPSLSSSGTSCMTRTPASTTSAPTTSTATPRRTHHSALATVRSPQFRINTVRWKTERKRDYYGNDA